MTVYMPSQVSIISFCNFAEYISSLEERVAGGGSLNLTKFVALELGLEEGDISGTWDVAHQLQIIWNRALKKNPKALAVVKVFFDAMSDFSLGKSVAVLHDKAREMQTLILSSKSFQETRFVRSLLRGLSSGLRNLPTMAMIFEEEYELAVTELRNTDAKAYRKKLQALKSPKNILEAVGVCALLEIYAKASLEAQHSKHFPSQVWKRIKAAEAELEKLSQEWEWSEGELRKAGLEAPKKIVDRLKAEAKYIPQLKKNQVVRRQQEMRESGRLQEGQKVDDLFEEDEQVVPLAGELVLEEMTTDEVIQQVEKELRSYAKSILLEFKKRLVQPSLQAALSSLLEDQISKDHAVFDTSDEEDTETADITWSKEKKERYLKLKLMIKQLPERQAKKFDPDIIYPGLVGYNIFAKEQKEKDKDSEIEENVIYAAWHKKFVQCEDALESNCMFSKLFQNLQVRSTSEVKSICIYIICYIVMLCYISAGYRRDRWQHHESPHRKEQAPKAQQLRQRALHRVQPWPAGDQPPIRT